MSKLLVKNREIVSPGEFLADGMDFIPSDGTYRKGEKIVANTIGIANIKNRVVKVIALKGSYMPQRGDYVIGKITDLSFSSWYINIETPYDASLPMREASREFIDLDRHDMTHYYTYGDLVFAKIIGITKSKIVTLTMKEPELKKLKGGITMKINSSKIPRIIGTKGSMINMIKEKTNTQIIIGQNGVIWMKGEANDLLKVKEAIRQIEKESHLPGLTEKIEKKLGGKK